MPGTLLDLAAAPLDDIAFVELMITLDEIISLPEAAATA